MNESRMIPARWPATRLVEIKFFAKHNCSSNSHPWVAVFSWNTDRTRKYLLSHFLCHRQHPRNYCCELQMPMDWVLKLLTRQLEDQKESLNFVLFFSQSSALVMLLCDFFLPHTNEIGSFCCVTMERMVVPLKCMQRVVWIALLLAFL